MAKRDRRAELMRATETLFASRRFHEITLDEVIREAKVGKGTVYRYFKDKDDLFFETAMAGFDELCDVLLKAASRNDPFDEQLLRTCRRISAFFRKRRPLFRMMHSEEWRVQWRKGGFRRRWHDHRKRLDAAATEMIRRGIAEGALRRDIRPAILARFLLGMLRTRSRGAAHAVTGSGGLALVVDLFLRGAGAKRQRNRSRRQNATC